MACTVAQVDAKKAVPKDDHGPGKHTLPNGLGQSRSKKIFVGGLAPSVDEAAFRRHFERFGSVEDAVVMYDHDNRRPRGFGFVTFCDENSIDGVFSSGIMQTLHDKPIEIKRAVPRDQMPPVRRSSFLAAQQQQQAAAAVARAAGLHQAGSRGLRHFADPSLMSQSYPPSAYAGLGGVPDPNLGLRLSGLPQDSESMASLYDSLQRNGGTLPGFLSSQQPQQSSQAGFSQHQELLRSMQALSLGTGLQSQLAGLGAMPLPGGMASSMGGLSPSLGSNPQADGFLNSPQQSSPSAGPAMHHPHQQLDHGSHAQSAAESPGRPGYMGPQLHSQPSYDQDRQLPYGHMPVSPASHISSRQQQLSNTPSGLTPSLSSAFSSNLSDSSIVKQW